MEQLESYRNQIDNIDKEIVRLLEQRFKICLCIGKYKKEIGLDILNESREKEVIDKNISLVQDDFYKDYIQETLLSIMSESRKIQSKI